jgi:phage terminase small subunit
MRRAGEPGSREFLKPAKVPLRPRHERFCLAVLRGIPNIDAYLEAGYRCTRAAASVAVSRLMRRPDIRERLDVLSEKAAADSGVTTERVLSELAKVAFLDIGNLFDKHGNLKSITELDDDTAAGLARFEYEEIYTGRGETRERIGRVTRIKLHDKLAALTRLARLLGMFREPQQPQRVQDNTLVVRDLRDKSLYDCTGLSPEVRK